MKKEIEISGKTREEAIEKAVQALGAPSASAIMWTIINEGRKGFLGFGAVDCTIKAVYQVAEPSEEKPRRERRDRNDRRGRRGGDSVGARAEERDAPKAEEASQEPPAPVTPPVENIDPATATESEQAAYRFICRLVENMGLTDVTIAMHPGRNDDMVITLDGENAGVLIGHHGDTLDALQYLANLAANRREEGEKREYARITVDVESYRAKREEALRILARKKAHQVLRYKKSIMLEPMNPYERRIIHSEIQKMGGVSTNSIGVENNRRIVIFLEDETPPTGLKTRGGSDKNGNKTRNRRKNRSPKAVDPLSSEAITGETRRQGESIFSGEEHDPFDIDLSAATYSEEETEEHDPFVIDLSAATYSEEEEAEETSGSEL